MKKTILLFCSFIAVSSFAQITSSESSKKVSKKESKLDPNKKYTTAVIGFYNLENLFDTIVDLDTNKILQKEFTPQGGNKYGTKEYQSKLTNLSKVISDLGVDVNADGPAIMGVAEIENRSVLEDLVKQPSIKDRNYQIVHEEGSDKRGIDVGFLYNPKYFEFSGYKTFRVRNPEDTTWRTRDQLLVTGKLMGEEIHVLVCHWPSRRSKSYKRVMAADVAKSIIDSLRKTDANAKFFVMGDLNDDPISPSVKKTLMTKKKIEDVEPGYMYNPWEKFYNRGEGTLAWKDSWNLFDQIIVSEGAAKLDYSTFQYYGAKVYNKEYLKNQDGNYRGQPFRTYSFGRFIGGYSDHFPVYLYLVREQ